MSLVRTYVDSSVLISAFSGNHPASAIARAFLFDPLREYVTSDFVRIEVEPKCVYFKNRPEQEAYKEFFQRNARKVPASQELLEFAIEEGCKTGVSGMDALHVVCALVAEARSMSNL